MFFVKVNIICIKLIIFKCIYMCNDMIYNVIMYKSDIIVNRNGNE